VPDDVSEGIIVLEAVGPAKKAGLKFSDLIVKLDKQDVGSTLELRKYLYSEKKIGDSVEVTFYRNGEKMTTKLKLEERTDEEE
jgi:serine protease Do